MDPDDLRYAAGRNQLALRFEPLVDARGVVSGFLARQAWAPPGVDVVGPARVQALARTLGIARELDAWAVEQVCTAVAGWGGEALDALALVAVAVAPSSLADAGLRSHARAAAEIAGLPPDRLLLLADDGTVDALGYRRLDVALAAADARTLLTNGDLGDAALPDPGGPTEHEATPLFVPPRPSDGR